MRPEQDLKIFSFSCENSGLRAEIVPAIAFGVGPWEVFPDLHELRQGETVRRIQPRLMALLVCLAERPGQTWTPFVNEELRQRLLTSLIKLAQQSVPPAGRTPEGHDWLRRRAIEIVASAASGNETKTDAQAVSAIREVLVDRKSALKVRLTAAAAWAHCGKKDALAKDQLTPLLRAVVDLASTVIDSQLIRGTKGRFDLKQDESRRVLAARLSPLFAAAQTAAALPNSTPSKGKNSLEKSPATALMDALQFCLRTIGSDEFSDRQVAQAIREQRESFPSLLASESLISR